MSIATDFPVPLERIPAKLVCGFQQLPRVRAALLELGDDISLLDLRKHLNGDGTLDTLASVAKTGYEKQLLLEGYLKFIAATKEGVRQERAKSEKLVWIIADSRLTSEMELNTQTVDRIIELGAVEQLGCDYQNWLPWVSLRIINLLRRWQQSRIRVIRRAMLKLSFESEVSFPWETGYTTWQRHLPMQVLYRYEPGQPLEKALTAFSNLGLTSINDLRCCHPDAVAASKAKEQPLFALYRILEQEGSSLA